MCYHIIALANLRNLTNFEDAAIKTRLGPKQGRGRRQKMGHSLNKPKAAKAKSARNATSSTQEARTRNK